MKSTILSLSILAGLVTTLVLKSQQPTEDFDPLGEVAEEDLPKVIRVHTEFIELPQATYTKLMSKPSTSANDTQLREECAKLISKGEARMLESMCVTAFPGQSATSESIAEYIYPTEYNPGEFPTEINGEGVALDSPLGSPPNPTSFETKNTGSTLEVEAQIDQNGSLVELRFTPTLIYLEDMVNYGAEKISGAAGPVLMPQFYVLSVKTGATLVGGQPTMVSVLSPQNDKGFTDSSRKVMVFVRADILTVGK
jgi:hypothetical protein